MPKPKDDTPQTEKKSERKSLRLTLAMKELLQNTATITGKDQSEIIRGLFEQELPKYCEELILETNKHQTELRVKVLRQLRKQD
jgi:predicted DNA-binding protein